jgi:hypothetical protein
MSASQGIDNMKFRCAVAVGFIDPLFDNRVDGTVFKTVITTLVKEFMRQSPTATNDLVNLITEQQCLDLYMVSMQRSRHCCSVIRLTKSLVAVGDCLINSLTNVVITVLITVPSTRLAKRGSIKPTFTAHRNFMLSIPYEADIGERGLAKK